MACSVRAARRSTRIGFFHLLAVLALIVITLFAIGIIELIHSGGFTQNKMPNTNNTDEPKNQTNQKIPNLTVVASKK